MNNNILKLFQSQVAITGGRTNTSFSTTPTEITEGNAAEVFRYDHTPISFKNGCCLGANFEYATAIVFDIDNSHSDNPADWVHQDEITSRLKKLGFNYWIVASRNHQLPKDGKTPRPKFHVYLPLSVSLNDSDKFVRFCQWCIKTFGADSKVKSKAQKLFGYGDNSNAFVEFWRQGRCVDEILTDDDLVTVVTRVPVTPAVCSSTNGVSDFDWFADSGEWRNHLNDLEELGWEFIEKDDRIYFQTKNGDHEHGKQDGNIKDGVAYFFSMAPAPFVNHKGYSICHFYAGILFGDTSIKGLAKFAKRYFCDGRKESRFDVRTEIESTGVPLLDDFCAKLQCCAFQSNGGTPNQMEYVVQSVDELIRVAVMEQLDLTQRNGEYLYYNGRFWEKIARDSFYVFLRNAVMRFGVPKDMARYYAFQDKIRSQFRDIANFPFTPIDETIRINLKNGTLEFRDGQEPMVVPFDKRHGLCYQLDYDFDPNADCSLYRKFLDRCIPEKSNQMILEEYSGYIFISKLNLEKILFLYGQGMNGKSVVIAVLKALLGEANVTEYSLESITKKPEYRAKLAEGILNISAESANSLNIDVFKKIASREPLECRSLYKDPIVLTDYSRQLFSTNTLPKITEATEGFFRRFLFIPFEQYITEDERNPRMNMVGFWEESGELPGILNMVIAGLRRLVQNGIFTKSQSSNAVLDDYKYDSNSVLSFMQDEGYKPCTELKIKLTVLLESYQCYCNINGLKPVSSKTFAQRLRNLGYTVGLGRGNVNYVHCRKEE